VVLVEHFTNSGDATSKNANSAINKLTGNNKLDVIDIQYHAEVSGVTDKMNEDNPAPASARSLYYGKTDIPYTILDGGGTSGDWIYNYKTIPLDTLDLYTRVLQDPSFDIGITAGVTGGSMSINIELEALATLPNKEYILYTAIIEKQISDPSYVGTNGETVFQNVARVMLPSAAGQSFIQAWNPGDKQTANFNWTIAHVLNEDLAYVVAFIQDASSKEIYQTASNDPDLWATSIHDVLAARDLFMLVYPNPASKQAHILFADALTSPVEIQVFNHLGSLVKNGVVKSGEDFYEFDVSEFSKGVYFIRALQNGRVLETSKLIIIH
jgi:hypothetical protein